jgi:hypothetical protein
MLRSPKGGDRLTLRQLNRATLERQLLLRRATLPVAMAIEHLVGLQGQAPDAPYVGLWGRLEAFSPEPLSEMVRDLDVVRMPLQRATVHLVTAHDAERLRPMLQGMIERRFGSSVFAKQLGGAKPGDVAAAGWSLLSAGPMTRPELAKALGPRWPSASPEALSQAVAYLVPVAQAPPRGMWRSGGAARWMLLPSVPYQRKEPTVRELGQLLLRYLAAFGPATIADARIWSGLGGFHEAAQALGDAVRRFRGEEGQELLDLADAPRQDADEEAPPRFLPEYDNVMFSFADRRRLVDGDQEIPLLPGNGGKAGLLLIDGFYRGTWSFSPSEAGAILDIETFSPLRRSDSDELVAEGVSLLSFLAPGRPPEVRLRT